MRRIILRINLYLCTLSSTQAFTTLFYQVTPIRSSLNALSKFPSILSCIMRLPMLNRTASRGHLIPDHTTSMRHSILDKTARIAYYPISYSKDKGSHTRTQQVWGISSHKVQGSSYSIISNHIKTYTFINHMPLGNIMEIIYF